ncbi:MAG TPA: hypothetical protein VIM71_10585 [Lacunisphaera sp.]
MPLFSHKDLNDVLSNQRGRVSGEVEKLSRDQVSSLTEDRLVDHVVAKLRIEPIVLREDKMLSDIEETQVDVSFDRRRAFFNDGRQIFVPGHKAKIVIPFDGEADLFACAPSSRYLRAPHGEYDGGKGILTISHIQPADEPHEQIKQSLEKTLADIRFYLGNQQGQIAEFNAKLPDDVRTHVKARKARLGAQNEIQKMLGIPLKKRDGAANFEPINMPRQLVRPLPSVPVGGFPAEPGITAEQYAHILGVIRHAGRTFERTPKTYISHGEEELRDIVLANLNSHYQGTAGGEVFRRKGKTDICIEEKSRAAFVAECKVWRGAAEFKDAIDQLLSYLTWRDCKAALVIFNKNNAKFSELIAKLSGLVQTHVCFRRTSKSTEAGEWTFTLADPKDDGREIELTVFAFNLHV